MALCQCHTRKKPPLWIPLELEHKLGGSSGDPLYSVTPALALHTLCSRQFSSRLARKEKSHMKRAGNIPHGPPLRLPSFDLKPTSSLLLLRLLFAKSHSISCAWRRGRPHTKERIPKRGRKVLHLHSTYNYREREREIQTRRGGGKNEDIVSQIMPLGVYSTTLGGILLEMSSKFY